MEVLVNYEIDYRGMFKYGGINISYDKSGIEILVDRSDGYKGAITSQIILNNERIEFTEKLIEFLRKSLVDFEDYI